MDNSNVCVLIGYLQLTRDEIGNSIREKKETEVYCTVSNVSGAEWGRSFANGIKSQLVLTVFNFDYNKEKTVIYDGEEYGIYRTFKRDKDHIELYLELKGGLDGK